MCEFQLVFHPVIYHSFAGPTLSLLHNSTGGRLWMSREGNDFSYKTKKGTVCSGELTRRTDISQRTARLNYTEVEITRRGVQS